MKIIVFPRDANPYQELLYKPLRKLGLTVTYLEGPTKSHTLNLLLQPAMLIIYRMLGYELLHLHWTYPFQLPWFGRIGKLLMEIYFMLFLVEVKLLRLRLVWTVHNVLPHRPIMLHDAAMRRILAKFADAKIVHSASTIEDMSLLSLNLSNVFVVPHGNYSDVYPNNITSIKARAKLGIKDDEQVILFFGLIQPYKGLDDLLVAFKKLKMKNTRLLIIGKCMDDKLCKQIIQAQKDFKINFYNNYVPNKDVATYFNAANIVCLPFKSITTSGSALLALTFGRPLVAPRVGSIKDFPSSIGFFYSNSEDNGLEKALMSAFEHRDTLNVMVHSAAEYAQTLNWDNIAGKTLKVYNHVLD